MSDNKRIAKNTIMLYFRMILNLIVSIYTGRVVLQVLGVDDFGIYNIVGGVVVLFSFINNFLNTACQRFISVSIVESSKSEPVKVFHTALFLHFIIAVLFVLAAETLGLWFVSNKLVLPDNRLSAAIWLYHICVLNTCLTILRVPYNAAIIAEEKMDFYAYTSIGETLLRLLIVYCLSIIAYDKLLVYGLLQLLILIIMLVWYIIYAKRRFSYCSFSMRYDIHYLKQMLSFSGWNLFGSLADIAYKQGSNIILNIFYGVGLNAAMGLATTVRSTIFNFVSNFQVASNPQIIKQYSSASYVSYCELVYRVSKFSYILMLFIALPAFLNMNFILSVWLDTVPPYTALFVQFGLLYCLIDCLHGPLWTTMISTGRIRNYQVFTSVLLFLNLPLSYVALSFGYSPISILVIQIFISLVTLLIRIAFSSKYAQLNCIDYINKVLLPIICLTVFAVPFPFYISSFYEDSFYKLVFSGLLSVSCVFFATYFVALSSEERKLVNQFLKSKFSR